MRRWNGWGDDGIEELAPPAGVRFLAWVIGEGTAPRDATLADVVSAVPPSRLPAHPLVVNDPETLVRHARGLTLGQPEVGSAAGAARESREEGPQ